MAELGEYSSDCCNVSCCTVGFVFSLLLVWHILGKLKSLVICQSWGSCSFSHTCTTCQPPNFTVLPLINFAVAALLGCFRHLSPPCLCVSIYRTCPTTSWQPSPPALLCWWTWCASTWPGTSSRSCLQISVPWKVNHFSSGYWMPGSQCCAYV